MQISQDQRNFLILWYLLQHSTSALQKLLQHFKTPEDALSPKNLSTWQTLKLHKNHIARFQQFMSSGDSDFKRIEQKVMQHCDAILLSSDPYYPERLKPFQEHIPILFIKGDINVLNRPQIAMVGSRKPSPHGHKLAFDFADYFAQQSYVITSGLAAGIDAAAHQGSLAQGQSIAVVGTGLDQCYPSQHQNLQQQILHCGGAIVSQFLPETPPIKPNFPKRNYIISALSQATLVVEASLNSGSLITAKLAAEQGKYVFAIPGHISAPHHQGCHYLIREGATLVDHPAQVIEDLNTFSSLPITQQIAQQTIQQPIQKAKPSTPVQVKLDQAIPEHLQQVYQHLSWEGISVDHLASATQLDIQTLNILLTELELLGLCVQHAGRYLKQ